MGRLDHGQCTRIQRPRPDRSGRPAAPDVADVRNRNDSAAVTTPDPLARALRAVRQSKHVALRAGFDPAAEEDWCGLVLDLVAMANTDGGALVLGLGPDGSTVGLEPAVFHALDRASVIARVKEHTRYDFPELTLRRCEKDGEALLAFVLERSLVPIPFTKAFACGAEGRRRAVTISPGAVYVRRGGRSVPAKREDLASAIRRRIDEERGAWRQRLRDFIRIPASVRVSAGIGDVQQVTDPGAPAIRLVDEPDAPAYRLENPDSVYPYRQKELIARLRELLPEGMKVTAHTLLTINWAHRTRERPEWTYHPKFGSVQYNEAFARWIVEQVEQDPQFLEKAHHHWYVVRYGKAPDRSGDPLS